VSLDTQALLDQFVLEARECLELIGRRLLDVERAPDDPALLNDLFRAVHTLKGNCGLFDFKALEAVVHAGEDVLDAVRHGRRPYDADVADALLAAMDLAVELVDAIAGRGALPATADARSVEVAKALRGLVAALDAGVEEGGSAAAAVPPSWLDALPSGERVSGRVAIRYRPEPECFFKGEDPWHLARRAPGLLHLEVRAQEPWAAAADYDCYRCNLEFLLLCAASAELADHFRYVPEQTEVYEFPPVARSATAGDAVLDARRADLWQEQRLLLAAPASPGAIAAVRRTLANLLATAADSRAASVALAELDALPPGADALAGWAERHAPSPRAVAGVDSAAAPGETRSAAAAASASADDAAGPQRVVKVAQEKIDQLMDLIGEIVVAKNALPYLADRAEQVYGQRDLAREIKAQYAVVNRIADDMQRVIMQVRMLPVGTVFHRFSRLVRDTSRRLGKEVNLVIEGEDTEADKNVVESLADPLIHLVRNSLDHGIELPEVRAAAGKARAGTLRVTASQVGDRVSLEIADDGAGIDPDRVRAKAVERGLVAADRAAALSDREAAQLVFLPGFSTAETISDLSGRGVGMDVVRSAVERVNGTVELDSERGRGTRVRLELPLSIAVTHVMAVSIAGRRFGIPMDAIVETVRIPAASIHRFKDARTTVLRGRVVGLRELADVLELDQRARPNAEGNVAVLVIRGAGETVGIVVDDFLGTSDIILKPLDGFLAGLGGVAGTALMGDGSVLLVLDPRELLR
jgi:two-component system chemotaxis sensor kinase CheA